MNPHRLFLNGAGRLRSGWRLLLFVLVYFALLFLMSTGVRILYAITVNITPGLRLGYYFEKAIYRTILLAAALIAGILCTRWLEGLPWHALGLSLQPGWIRDLSIGSIIGAASLALAAGIAFAAGGIRFAASGKAIFPEVGRTLIVSAALFIVAALAEEALFRGYPLQTMTRAGLAWLGILFTSLPFAAVHLKNPNVVQGFTFINTALAGVWLATAYLRTRNLWFPLGLHWAWNWAMGSLFGLPVSGITEIAPHPLLHGFDYGPVWLTGGSYGIEGGAACTITLLVSTTFIWRTQFVSATEEMKKLTSQENPTAEELTWRGMA